MRLLLILALTFLPNFVEAKKKTSLVTQVSRQKFEISRSAVERDLKDPMAQLDTFRIRPLFGMGYISGLKVSQFSDDCLLPKFGLKEGDIVEMVNGQPLSTPSDIQEVGEKLAKARAGSKVRVNLRREDQDLVLTYLVVD